MENDGHINLRLPLEVIEKIDKEAEANNVKRSAVVRKILLSRYEVPE